MKRKTKRPSRYALILKYKYYWFVVVFGLLATYLIYTSYAATPVKYSVIVIAGQSNADGAESYVVDPTTNVNVFAAPGHPADSATKLIWSNLSNNSGPPPVALNSIATQSGKYTNDVANFGPEVGLARGLYDHGQRNVLILKVSYGGLSLASKAGIDWNVDSSNEAYSMLLSRMKETKAWIASQGGTASIDGFYWVQGEADATPTFAPLYEQNLQKLVTQARSDLGMTKDAPFVIAKTSIVPWIQTAQALTNNNPCGATSCEALAQADATVRAAQQKIADTIPNTKAVDTLPLPRHGFKIHLSNQGELQLGALFAQASFGTAQPTQSIAPSTTKNSVSSPATSKTKTSTPNATTTKPVTTYDSPAQALAETPTSTQTSKPKEQHVSWWKRIISNVHTRISNFWLYLTD